MQKIICLILFSSFTFSFLNAVIVEAPNLDVFQEAVAEANEEDLVLFDVDETLIIPKDRILRSFANKERKKHLIQLIHNLHLDPNRRENIFLLESLITSQMEFRPIDEQVFPIIESLQEKNIPTIAFTWMGIGPYGVIPSLEDWRIAHLKQLNFDFSQAFIQHPVVPIPEIPSSGRKALFKQGVLCANQQNKGPVLVAFLKQIGWKPKKIIFIDDQLNYLLSVEEALADQNIEFVGFYYTAVDDNPCSLDEEIVELQIQHFTQTGVWLSEDAVAKLHEGKQED